MRRSQRMKTPVIPYGIDEYADVSITKLQHVAFKATEIEEPTNIEEALSGNHSKQWKAAADAEYQSLRENGTLEPPKERMDANGSSK